MAGVLKIVGKRRPQKRFIVAQQYFHAFVPAPIQGNSTVAFVPTPFSLVNVNAPRYPAAIWYAIDNPNPVPFPTGFVVWK